ncbi:MAG: hypothetical protein A2068_09555 [Ignavibacteria bacterium GWB2_35_6b]|nr:MAG: hypothetical protein A2068_09555 [Ignavibacteria bacterium GWB2_35_6b]
MTNIIIIEDVKTIREGLKTLIDASDGLNCIGAYENFEDFINAHANNLPDVLLIDLNLPGISGIEGIKKINQLSKECTIIVLTVYEENDKIFEALLAGASCYLVKNTPPSKMIKIIKDAAEGFVPMNSFIARKTFTSFDENKKLSDLSSSELNILKKMVEGNSLKAIEETLKINMPEIRNHFKEIYSKLHRIYGFN